MNWSVVSVGKEAHRLVLGHAVEGDVLLIPQVGDLLGGVDVELHEGPLYEKTPQHAGAPGR